MVNSLERPLLLWGRVVLPDGTAPQRYVLVQDGRIVSVSRQRPPRTDDAVFIKTDFQDWIFPGLLDLHTHTTYNLLPIWDSPNAPFNNRFEWRSDAGYKKAISAVQRQFDVWKNERNRKTIGVFSELQAIAGGTTVLQQSLDLERDFAFEGPLLCRDTSAPEDLLLDADAFILSVVDFFRPDPQTGTPSPVDKSINRVAQSHADPKKHRLHAILAHLAEGRSGFGTYRGVDPYSRQEFEAFMAHPAFQDVEAMRRSPLTITHGCGIDVTNSEHITFLRERNISVIWSPVSNLLLYGDTLDAETLLAEGINVALGSDWSPSGSKHVWDEAKFARFFFDTIGAAVSDEQIFQMVTTNAGRCLGIPHLGRIEPGGLGDFFIVRSPLESDNPLEVFLTTTDRDVRATLIGGRPIYGARDFLKPFAVDLQRLPKAEGSAVEDKAVHLPLELGVNVDDDITDLELFLKGLDEPVKRSNILASSDKIYRRRIQQLKAQTAYPLGWSVQERRKKAPSQTPGAVPVSPASMRVWWGYRAAGLTPARFRGVLGDVFIPATVQMQRHLGMTAYLPTVLPDDKPDAVPDEIALVFYESKKAYTQTKDTTTGLTYATLHGIAFSFTRPLTSRSDFPSYLQETFEAGKYYYLIRGNTDWYHGVTRVLVGARNDAQTPGDFLAATHEALKRLQDDRPEGLDGAIASASNDCLLYWEHWTDEACVQESTLETLAALVTPVLLEKAVPVKVPLDPYQRSEPDDRLLIEGGECMTMRFPRRRLFLD